jgi:hypothetical protein
MMEDGRISEAVYKIITKATKPRYTYAFCLNVKDKVSKSKCLNSYFHMSSAIRSLLRYEAEYLITESARILNNIFRVRLGKVLKNINLL